MPLECAEFANALSAAVASASIFGCHLAGDFFLGVDILVTSMLVSFLLMAVSLLVLARRNPALASAIRTPRNPQLRDALAAAGVAVLGLYLAVHVGKDLAAELPAWYFHSTWLWLAMMALASAVFGFEWRRLRTRGIDLEACFRELPPQ